MLDSVKLLEKVIFIKNEDNTSCSYTEWEKPVQRWRLKAQEKRSNLENEVLQEVGWG
jgi:hypothetical protein